MIHYIPRLMHHDEAPVYTHTAYADISNNNFSSGKYITDMMCYVANNRVHFPTVHHCQEPIDILSVVKLRVFTGMLQTQQTKKHS